MAVAISRVTTAAATNGSGTTVTFSAISIGTAAADRIVAVAQTSEDATAGAVTGVTVGTYILTCGSSAQFSAVNASIWHTLVPANTTADVVVSYTSTAPNSAANRITVYTASGADTGIFSAAKSTSTDMDSTAPLSAAITIPTGGAALAIAAGAVSSTTAKTWASITEDIEIAAANYTHTVAFTTTSGSPTITCTGTTNGEDGAMAVVVFQAASNRQTLNKPFTLQPILAQ